MALRARGSSMTSAAVPARESCHHQARAKARAAAKGNINAGAWTRPSNSLHSSNQARSDGVQVR